MPAEADKSVVAPGAEGQAAAAIPVRSSASGVAPSADRRRSQTRAVTFRNNRLVLVMMLLLGVASLISSLGFGILALGQLFLPWHGFGLVFVRIFGVLSCAVTAWVSWLLGAAFWRLTFAMSHNIVRFDDQGIHFRSGPKKKTCEIYLAWGQIAAIRHQRVGNNQYYGVVAKDGTITQFTSFTFFRAKKLAREIAARSGHSIDEA